MSDKHTHDDTCTGHAPHVWQCQNPKCNAVLDAGSIGRDGPGEDAELFCTSCSSRDVRLIEMEHPLFSEVTKLITGESHCHWQSWLKSHYQNEEFQD